MTKSFYTVPEIATLLQISKSKAYDLVNTEDVPTLKIGKTIRIPKVLFEEWLTKHIVLTKGVM